ncbi:hypothetical protein Tco_0892009 [Tanacetum coccineum]|uniref:Gag protein n=1 Tax=Tanacetum coccineum TaxID=301880 RepID=A0ABQ5C6H9_9ASTR
MTPLAEYMIVAGAENRSPMIDKSMYNSWESRMLLYIKGNKNGRMMLESIENGPLVYPTVEENGQIRKKKYAELTEQEQLQDDYDVQAINIVLQCTELSYQERECKLYNEFDKFTSVNGESLHEYYLRFSQLINDMHTIGMTMQQVQVNTKFQNALQPEWSKFVTDVKLAKNMYNTNYDQLYAYLSQNEGHANEYPQQISSIPQTPYHPLPYQQGFQTQLNHTPTSVPQNAYYTTPITQQPQVEFPQLDSGLALPSFLPATIQDGKFTIQQVQGRHGQSYAGTGTKGNATSSGGNNAAGLARVVKCYNCQAQESGQVLDEEQLAFLVDLRVADGQDIQAIITYNAAFQTDDLDAYESNCDDISSAKAILMANISSYSSNVL